MIEVEQAIRMLQDALVPQTQTITVPILEAKDRISARDICSPIHIPPYSKAAMDGYAIFSADSVGASKQTPIMLTVIGELCPGDSTKFEGERGTAVRIMTGAPIPSGYDCVIKQEDTDYGAGTVQIFATISPKENYSPIGEDVRKDATVILKHTKLSHHHVGLLASMGFQQVEVLRPLRVGILATGSELVKPGQPLGFAQIYNSTSYTIVSYLREAGVEVQFLAICGDHLDEFYTCMQQKIDQVDLVITTGAVSVGKSDFVPSALAHLQASVLFHGVKMKPGTPVMAAVYAQKPIMCLSGNPFAAFVNFQLFFWPMLAHFLHTPSFSWRSHQAVVAEGEMKAGSMRRFIRARWENHRVYLYTKNHQSSIASNLSHANCLIDQPPNVSISTGDSVRIIRF